MAEEDKTEAERLAELDERLARIERALITQLNIDASPSAAQAEGVAAATKGRGAPAASEPSAP